MAVRSATRITKSTVDALQPGEKDVYLWDAEIKGFACKCTPTGRKVYVYRYRLGGRAGKNAGVTLGVHGSITPFQARELAKIEAAKVARGVDPAAEKREAKEKAAKALTVGDAIELYLSTNGKDNRSWPETRRLLEHDAVPYLGKRPMPSITMSDAVTLIDTVSARAPSVARNLFRALNPFFKWAKQRGHIPINPLSDLDAPPKGKARNRTLKEHEIKAFWKATTAMGYPFGPAFQLLLLTAQREEEVGGIEWPELNLSKAEWIHPDARAKNGQEHAVDLSPQALAIIDALPHMACEAGKAFVFTTTNRNSISGWSNAKTRLDWLMCAELNGALWNPFMKSGGRYPLSQTLTDEIRQRRDKAAQKLGFPTADALQYSILPAWRIHDIRHTAATGMGELGATQEVVDLVQNHVKKGMAAVYQHQLKRPERREAILKWGAHVEQLVSKAQ